MVNHRLKISVCILTFNHEQYISSCLSSVVSQRVNAELEILVGDDCSTDGTRKIITEYAEKYPALIIPVFQEKNIGGTKNFFSVISKATGDFIAQLDGDDFWLPEKLAMQLDFLIQHPECVAVYSNAVVFDNQNRLLGAFNNPQPNIFDINYLLEKGNFLNSSSTFYHAKFKNELLQIKKDFLDYRTNLTLAKHGKLGYLNETFVVYRYQTPTSMMLNMPIRVEELYWEAILELDAENVRIESLKKSVSYFYFAVCINALRHGNLKPITNNIKKIISYKNTNFAIHCVGLAVIHFFMRLAIFPINKTLKLLNTNPIRIFHKR
jgi:glycosyltransferase involved in cell wall biosynthesis